MSYQLYAIRFALLSIDSVALSVLTYYFLSRKEKAATYLGIFMSTRAIDAISSLITIIRYHIILSDELAMERIYVDVLRDIGVILFSMFVFNIISKNK